ncbi:MAG: pyridoxamine 5'-phosphate oxidase family protein [Candidatus Binataceae bacterium]
MTDPSRTPATSRPSQGSPFHPGELAVQDRVGFREKIDRYGRTAIRTYMPEQHRVFFGQLPFFVVGTAEISGQVWASMLAGEPGFIQSPNHKLLTIAAMPGFGDPGGAGLYTGASVGGLGIELHTRRRNRVNGRVSLDPGGTGFSLSVDQSFGNCTKYITPRRPTFVRQSSPPTDACFHHFTTFDALTEHIIDQADTFFIASRRIDGHAGRSQDADVSHRGGPAGFLHRQNDRTLIWPEYRGNFFFNTVGNLVLNPRCGILVVDFARGDSVQMTGQAEVVWEWNEADPALRGAQRLVKFELERGVRIDGGYPFSWDAQPAVGTGAPTLDTIS